MLKRNSVKYKRLMKYWLINKNVWFMIKVEIQFTWVKQVWVEWMVFQLIWVVCLEAVKDLICQIYYKICLVAWAVETFISPLMVKMYQCNFNKVANNQDVETEVKDLVKDSNKWVAAYHLIYLDSLDFDFVYSFKMTKNHFY